MFRLFQRLFHCSQHQDADIQLVWIRKLAVKQYNYFCCQVLSDSYIWELDAHTFIYNGQIIENMSFSYCEKSEFLLNQRRHVNSNTKGVNVLM